MLSDGQDQTMYGWLVEILQLTILKNKTSDTIVHTTIHSEQFLKWNFSIVA